CEAMEGRGVPAGTAAKVRAAAEGKLDPQRILEIEQTTRHDGIAFLTHVEQLAGEPARWLHLGMTSSDVLDTALALQTTRALDVLLGRVGRLRGAGAVRGTRHPRRRARAARRAAGQAPPPRADADEGPLARHPRRADHRRAHVRALARR